MKGYLANGLFSLADRNLNDWLAGCIRNIIPSIDLYVPQENGEINNKQAYADAITIAKADSRKLLESDFVIAVIDGVEIDSGVAAEIGYAHAIGIPVYALYTDARQKGTDNMKKIGALVSDATENQFMYRNLFVIGLIKQNGEIFSDVPDLITHLMEVHND